MLQIQPAASEQVWFTSARTAASNVAPSSEALDRDTMLARCGTGLLEDLPSRACTKHAREVIAYG
ncbi:hypothetical protein [Nonomuraea typhae]|uniref:hypothetical protein n=1 Tax=Nonomuraea typhae TaxID=2603600 RepID=UPI001CA4D28B|nr:hypothetical protein [Nonomuraea typhae]